MEAKKLIEPWETKEQIPPGDFRDIIKNLIATEFFKYSYEISTILIIESYHETRKKRRIENEWGNTDFVRLCQDDIEPNAYYWLCQCSGKETEWGIDIEKLGDTKSIVRKASTHKFGRPWNVQLAKLNRELATTQRYEAAGMIQFIIDAIYWGEKCFWNNPDTIGSGDSVFSVWLTNRTKEATNTTENEFVSRYQFQTIGYTLSIPKEIKF